MYKNTCRRITLGLQLNVNYLFLILFKGCKTDLHRLNWLATYADGQLAGFFNLMCVSVRYVFLYLTHLSMQHKSLTIHHENVSCFH